MNTVEPIRDREQLEALKDVARRRGWRQYVMVLLGINTGLRYSDMARIKVSDLRSGIIRLRAKKTGKETKIILNSAIHHEFKRLMANKKDDDWVLPSRQGGGALKRCRAWLEIKSMCAEAGITENVGCHTLRKTYGYHFYKKYKDAVSLMRFFGHSRPDITLRYIGITQDEIDEKVRGFRL